MIVCYYDAVRELVGIENLVGGNINGPISKIEFVEGFTTLPTEEAVQAKLTELQSEYDAKQYQRDRAVAYPSIQDVVVALAEKEEGDDTMWKEITAKRQKVKADNPKPE